jgi:hypothetical protein
MSNEAQKCHFTHYLKILSVVQGYDRRDNVFALQGLSAEGFSNHKPNYRKPVEQVYTDVARDALSTEDATQLSLLSAGIGYVRAMKSLHSWVSEWFSGDRTSSPTNSGNRKERTKYDYQASGALSSKTKLGPQPNAIILEGLHVDDVHSMRIEPPLKLGSTDTHLTTDSESDAALSLWTRESWQLAQHDTLQTSPTGKTLLEAFWRTCIGNRLVSSEGFIQPDPAVYGQYF